MRSIAIMILLVVMKIHGITTFTQDEVNVNKYIMPMEALDLVKEAYATNFIKVIIQGNSKVYFYKLDIADYYLVYEDTDESTGYHLFHLYEFVNDDLDTGIGHTVTYGWYWLDPYTGDMWQYP